MARTPKYVVVRDALRDQIASREAGSRLPSTRQLQREFGVSTQTVNRALRDLVEEDVLERRHRSGTYVARPKTRALRIGLAWPETSKKFSRLQMGGRFLLAFQEAAHARNVNLQVAGNVSASRPPFLNEGGSVDAILIFFNSDRELTEAYDAHGIPVILIEPFVRAAGLPYFAADHYMVPYLALEHLESLGHKSIVHLNVETPPCLSNNLRRAGYRAAMSDLGLDKYAAARDLPLGDWSDEDAARLIDFFTERQATACFCVSDHQASGVMQVCQQAGIRIPDDLSLIGLEDSGIATGLSPPLTAIRAWSRSNIELVFQTVDDLIGAGSTPRHGCVLPVRLVERASTGPPRREWSASMSGD